MSDGGFEIFLQPGEWYVGEAGLRLRTTLGSCVAITLWHARRRIGAMCHYMLHRRHGPAPAPDGRYADEAMQLMARELLGLGVDPRTCEAKLFGGASMTAAFEGEPRSVAVANVAAARQLARHHGLRVRGEHLGGRQYRQLIFDIDSGDVWLRLGRPADVSQRRAG